MWTLMIRERIAQQKIFKEENLNEFSLKIYSVLFGKSRSWKIPSRTNFFLAEEKKERTFNKCLLLPIF